MSVNRIFTTTSILIKTSYLDTLTYWNTTGLLLRKKYEGGANPPNPIKGLAKPLPITPPKGRPNPRPPKPPGSNPPIRPPNPPKCPPIPPSLGSGDRTFLITGFLSFCTENINP